MLILYEICLIVYTLCYLPVLILKGKWHGGFVQRLGFFPRALALKASAQENVWLHAVSVGEVTAIAELLKRIKSHFPSYQIVLTVSTKTGYELAQKKFSQSAVILWAPLDFWCSVAHFVRVIKPKVYIVAETELWPNLFSRLNRAHIPIVLVNGRISDLSVNKYLKIRWFMKRFLGCVNSFCMQSQLDADRILAMGAPKERVKNSGNVKFDDLPQDNPKTQEQFGFLPNDQIWIAGSTHPGEEEIVLEVYKRVQKHFPLLRLVIVPRHIERVSEVERVVQTNGLFSVMYSEIKNQKLEPNKIVIVDAIGHLRVLYSLATIVFVGKSLTVQGGHNIIEPAFFSKPIIVGPHMQNFRDVMQAFKNKQAVIEVHDTDELARAMEDMLANPAKRDELGKKARNVIRQEEGATKRIMDEISIYMKARP